MIFLYIIMLFNYLYNQFEQIWNYFFQIPLNKVISNTSRIMILDPVGGSGKSTLAAKIYDNKLVLGLESELKLIQSDGLKYNNTRVSPETYVEKFNQLFEESNGKFIYEGTYVDIKLAEQKVCIDKVIAKYNPVIIWNDTPKIITLWRKAFRSLKRALGLVPQGSSPEKWYNVRDMLIKTYNEFDSRREVLMNLIDDCNSQSLRVQWPYYYDVN